MTLLNMNIVWGNTGHGPVNALWLLGRIILYSWKHYLRATLGLTLEIHISSTYKGGHSAIRRQMRNIHNKI